MLNWLHRPLVATLNQRETLVATLNNRDTLIHISIHKSDHPVITFPLNQRENPNQMQISINKREHPMIKFPLNKRDHPQTLL